MNNPTDIIRLNITLPEELVTRIRKRVKGKGVSRFLSEAAIEKIEKEEKERALEALMNAPGTFSEIKDPVNHIKNSRVLDERRSDRLDT